MRSAKATINDWVLLINYVFGPLQDNGRKFTDNKNEWATFMQLRWDLDSDEGVRVLLQDAVKILNERRHHGHSGWCLFGESDDNWLVRGKDQYEFFEPFEAIAIAEKYESEAKNLSPESKEIS